MKLKSKRLYLLLPFVIIVNTTALYLWKNLGWTKPTIVCTLFGIGTILFFFLMNQFYEYLQGNRGFIIGGTICLVLGGLYLLVNGDLAHVGISFVLIGVAMLFTMVLNLEGKKKKLLSIVIFFVGKAADVQQEGAEVIP